MKKALVHKKMANYKLAHVPSGIAPAKQASRLMPRHGESLLN
jgi:hypothetical protein